MDGWMDGWMDELVGGWRNRWMDGWMDGWRTWKSLHLRVSTSEVFLLSTQSTLRCSSCASETLHSKITSYEQLQRLTIYFVKLLLSIILYLVCYLVLLNLFIIEILF